MKAYLVLGRNKENDEQNPPLLFLPVFEIKKEAKKYAKKKGFPVIEIDTNAPNILREKE